MPSASTPREPPPRLRTFKPLVAGRGQQRRLPNDILLLDESYNASAISVRAALEVLHP